MTSDEKKPEPFTAWMAWHPEHGYCDVDIPNTKQLAIESLCTRKGYYIDGDLGPLQISFEEAYEDGWRVIEVEVRAKHGTP